MRSDKWPFFVGYAINRGQTFDPSLNAYGASLQVQTRKPWCLHPATQIHGFASWCKARVVCVLKRTERALVEISWAMDSSRAVISTVGA